MPFDSERFASHLRAHAKRHGERLGDCAKWVRQALEAAGADTTGHPYPAKLYGPILARNGFHEITVSSPETYPFLKGDIVVIQPTRHGNPAGHIAGYDGSKWISDFEQRDFWPGDAYRREKPSYVVYRR
jgi:hypothetical protein